MSLTELYSAMVEQVADRLAADRRQRQIERGPVGGHPPQPVLIEASERIRALELENAEIKAGFSAFVNLLMQKGIIQRGDLEGLMKTPRPHVEPASASNERNIESIPRLPNAVPAANASLGKRQKKRRR